MGNVRPTAWLSYKFQRVTEKLQRRNSPSQSGNQSPSSGFPKIQPSCAIPIVLSTFSIAPMPVHPTRPHARWDAHMIPDELMQAAGWSLLDRLPAPRSRSTAKRIRELIVLAWPQTVRLTVDPEGCLAVWCHPHPPSTDWDSQFPGPADTARALRVLEAVGIALVEAGENELVQLKNHSASPEAIANVHSRLEAEQRNFEEVAEALVRHAESISGNESPNGASPLPFLRSMESCDSNSSARMQRRREPSPGDCVARSR